MPENKKPKVLRGIMKTERHFEWKARNIDRTIDEETGRRVIFVKINKVTHFNDGSKMPTNFVEKNVRLRSRRYLQAQNAREVNSGSNGQEETSPVSPESGSGGAAEAPATASAAPAGEAPEQVKGGAEEAQAKGVPAGKAPAPPNQKIKKLHIRITKCDAKL